MKTVLFIAAITTLAACSSSPEPEPLPEPVEDARAAYELAMEAFETGRYRNAIAGFHGAQRRFLSLDDARGIAVSAINRAEIQLLLGENAAAGESLESARTAIARSANEHLHDRAQLLAARLAMDDDPARTRRLLNGLAEAGPAISAQTRLLLCELDLREGETRCAEALGADDTRTRARILHLQARAAMQRGEHETARGLLEHALRVHRALAFRPGIAAVHATLAELALGSGDRESAQWHLERALYLRLWVQDRVHAAEIVAELESIAEDDAVRARYRRLREALQDESTKPDWPALLSELVSPG